MAARPGHLVRAKHLPGRRGVARRHDYDLTDDGETVGRIYRMKAGRRSFTL
jgi:hypothetical protein